MAYQVLVSARRQITLSLHHGTIRYCLWFIHINGTHGQCTMLKMDNVAHFEMVGILCQISKAFLGESDVFLRGCKKLVGCCTFGTCHMLYVFGYMEYAGAVLGDSVKWK